MEIGQSPVDSAYIRQTPEPVERNETPRQERLESNQSESPAPATPPAQTSVSNGPVGGNIDTYA